MWEYFDERMPGARWFPGATLNYTHHALRHLGDDRPAIIALDETGAGYEVSGDRLRAQVASVAATLRDLGVGQGDRVVGYLPNTPHAIVAFLAAASLGAVWSVPAWYSPTRLERQNSPLTCAPYGSTDLEGHCGSFSPAACRYRPDAQPPATVTRPWPRVRCRSDRTGGPPGTRW